MHNDPKIALPKKSINKQGGALLLEAMIAIAIFSFGLLGLVGLQTTAIQNSTNAEERIQASLLANDMVAMLWARQSLTHASVAGDITAWKTRLTSSSGLPNVSGDVTISGNLATVSVEWKAPSKKATDNKSRYVTTVALK